MDDFHFIDTTDMDTSLPQRMLGRRYLPNTAKGASLDLVVKTATSLTSVSLPDGSTLSSSLRWSFDSNELLYGLMDVTIFSDGNLVPSAASGSGNYNLFGPIDTPYHGTTGAPDRDGQHSTRFSLSNVSGATRTILVYYSLRGIINTGGTNEQS